MLSNPHPMQQTCWSQIGVQGDRTCSELETVVHCQNCSVYSQAGRSLLDRPAPAGYVAEWTAMLAQTQTQQTDYRTVISVAIFRLGQEWLALPARLFNQVLEPTPVHSLPHRRDRILRGIVNVRGQILLCVSLHELLGIPADPESPITSQMSSPQTGQPTGATQLTHRRKVGSYPRLVVMAKQRNTWAFEVDEFYGLHRCQSEQLQNAPAFSSQSLAGFSQSILPWHEQNVSYLNADCLFNALQQQAL